MTINPALGKLKYNFQTFNFRNEGTIKLPKSGNNNQFGRDNCYELAIDIVIVSTTQEQYRNFKSSPSHGFFGYAAIVTQDCLLDPIPLRFARQRIYQDKVVEAYQTWQDLAVYLANTKKWFELLESVITQGEAASPTVKNICEIEAYSARWTELSIREVYVELPKESEFRIELSWVSPESFTDGCGKTQDGKSKQPDDPKKDAGLPKSGIQPKINPSANPFGGNPPSNGSINDPRFGNAIGDIDSVNPENGLSADDDANFGYFARIETLGKYENFESCNLVEGLTYYLVASGSTSINPIQTADEFGCDQTTKTWDIFVQPTNDLVVTNVSAISVNGTIIRAANLPTDGYFRRV